MKIGKVKICKHEGCINTPPYGRNECYRCRSRNIVARKPIDCVYYWLKKSAKKRGLEFSISLQWFRNFICQTDYMEERGRLADQLTIDRKDNLIGYTWYNLEVIPKRVNSSKYNQVDVKRELGPQYEYEEMPF